MKASIVLPQDDSSTVAKLAKEADLHPIIAKLLSRRGISNAKEVQQYFFPDASSLNDPALLPDIEPALDRLMLAKESGDKVLVHGDYDADGLTSTALLTITLNHYGFNVSHFIPNRISDGYGLKPEAIDLAVKDDIRLIITCDCGIKSVAEVAYAKQNNIDVIITDHHTPGSELPAAVAVVNPKVPDSQYPFKELAGVGVAAKLIFALQDRLGVTRSLNNVLRIAAIGTIADVVPLVAENRFIAKHGLQHLAGTPSVGLKELIRATGLQSSDISSTDIGFKLAPRLNAAGRFGSHETAMDLLLTRSEPEAKKLAKELNDLNSKRQVMVEESLQQAINAYEADDSLRNDKIIVLADPRWHKGIVGLLASRLVERYSRPAMIFAIEDDIATGSARSITPFNMVENLDKIPELFNRFGGHAMAAGFEIATSRLRTVREEINKIADQILTEDDLVKTINVDAELKFSQIDNSFIKQYKYMEPFGNANEEPLFTASHVASLDKPQVMKVKHLKLRLADENGCQMTALGWNMADKLAMITKSEKLTVVYKIMFNKWRGREELQLSLVDIQAM
jgi:single-stranded-DNA-specific exonuclease